MKVVTIIQARTTSTRLPNKVLFDVYGKSLLERVIEQSQKIKRSDALWVATSDHPNDDLIEMICKRKNVSCYRGALEDVRSRFYHIAQKEKADIIARVTADNPLTEPQYADELIEAIRKNPELDYARMDKKKILDGTGTEVFTFRALKTSVEQFDTDQDREHVIASIVQKMEVKELTPSDEALVSEKSYFVGVDKFEDYKKSCRLFETFGNSNTLKQLIKKLQTNGKVI